MTYSRRYASVSVHAFDTLLSIRISKYIEGIDELIRRHDVKRVPLLVRSVVILHDRGTAYSREWKLRLTSARVSQLILMRQKRALYTA